MTEVLKGAATGAMSGAVTGAVDAGTKVTGIGDESNAKSAGSTSKNKASVPNKNSASATKKKTGK